MHVNLVPMIDNSYFVTKKADSTADWPVSTVAQRSMYKIQARTKPPTTSITEKGCDITRSSLDQGTGREGQRSVGSRGLKQVSAKGERGREPSS